MRVMDDLALGRLFRELRVRLGWTQLEVARRAGISQPTYSAIERGGIGRTGLANLRRVGDVLEVRLVIDARWRGAAIDRVLSSRHAAMAEVVTRMVLQAGWEVRPEVSFNHFGERGVVDLVAWHADTQTALLVELKTELVDPNRLLETADRRRRLAATIAQPLGWAPRMVAQWVVVASFQDEPTASGGAPDLHSCRVPGGRSLGSRLACPTGRSVFRALVPARYRWDKW